LLTLLDPDPADQNQCGPGSATLLQSDFFSWLNGGAKPSFFFVFFKVAEAPRMGTAATVPTFGSMS
jgi:hypothetical protein